MSSNISGLFASPERRDKPTGGLRERWPTLIVLPVLVAFLGAAALTPMLHLLLGDSFGLSGGRQAPWTWSLAFVGLIGFWSAKAVGSRNLSQGLSSTILIVLGLLTIGLWWALEPHYDLRPLLRDPVSLVQGNGYLVVPLLLGIGVWYQGLRYDYDPGLFSPEEIRGNVQRSWALLAISIVLSAIVGGDAGGAGIRAAAIAVPIAMACSAGAVAAAEVDNTRWLAQRRGSTGPGWDRWTRLFAGIVVGSLVVTGIAALLLGPGALALVKDGMAAGFHTFGTVIYWIMFGIVYVLYWIFRIVAWILNGIFGDMIGPIEPPKMEQFGQPAQNELMEQGDSGPFPYASLMRWIALGIALLIAAVVIFQLTRSRKLTGEDAKPDEERKSIFSTSLARQQLRDLFRRKPKPARPARLDLEAPPGSVRESMLYLQVLATRQMVGRQQRETPADFTRRLALAWPDVAFQLGVMSERYERVRYGETPDDRSAVMDAWQRIWQSRKDARDPSEFDGSDT